MSEISGKWLKYIGNGLDMWNWLKYVGNGLAFEK